jgi:hypothetical protein
MSQLISAERASHWYRREEERWAPFYECPKKSGDGMKAVTLREARECNAVPSVTNVLNVLAKPGLEAWKATQYIEAALTLPRLPDEPLDAYAKRVVDDAEAKSAVARDFGTHIHKAIELELTRDRVSAVEELETFMRPIRDWLKDNVGEIYGAEIIVGSTIHGFAGKLDLDCELTGQSTPAGRALIDFKTQGVKPGKPPTFYSEWAKQLSAYKAAREESEGAGAIENCVSVVIDSGKPQTPFVHAWTGLDRHFELFKCCLEIWRDEKSYDPRKP